MNCGIMSPVSILQCLLLLLASLLVYGQLSDLRRCADPQCQKLISKAHTIMRYPSGTTGVLSFPNNAEVNVYSKEAGSNPDWWGVEINGKFGYAPKKFIREDKVLLKDDLLTHIVPVMSASMGLKKEIPIDPKILSKVNEVKNDENEDGGEEFDEEDELDGIQFYNKEDERQVKDEQKQDDLTEPSQASAPVNNVASVAQDSIGEKSPPESVLPSADISPVSISSPPVQISSDQPLSVKEISLPTNVEHTASSDPASILPSQVKYEVVDGTTLYVDSGDVTEPPIHLPSYQTPPPLPATTTHTAHVITPTPPLTPSLSQDTITVPPTAGEEPSRSQVLNTPELMMVSTGLPQSTIDKGEAPAAAGTPPIQPQKDHVSHEEPPEHLKAVPIGSGSISVTSSVTDESKQDAASIPSNQNLDENYKQIMNEGGIDNFQPSIVGIQGEQAPNSIGNFSSDSESAIPITNAAMTSDFTAPKPDDVLNIPADNKPNETNEPKATENVVEISGNNQDQTESLSPEASGLDGSPETSVPKVSARASALEGSTEASAFEGAPESFALEASPESLVLEGSGNEQKQASHSISDGYPETLATVSESEDLELEVEPQDSDDKAESEGSFFGAFFSGWSSTEEQKHEDEDEVSTDAPSNSGDESSDNLVNSGATVEENSQNSVQETSFITTMVKEPPSATITKSLEASAGMPGLASNTLETKYGGDEAQEPAAHSGQDESSSAESGYSSDEEINTSNPSTTHEPVAESGTDSLSHDHQPGEGEADEPHSEDGNVESSLQPPTEASSETNPEYAHASLDGLQDEPNKSHISSDLEHAHSDESADTEAPEASDAKSPESPDLGSPESENESSVSSDANAEDPSDLHHPESLTGHLLKTVEPILGESLSLALEHDLSAPVESRGSLMAMAIVAATILLFYVVHAAFTRSARESPLLEALNRLEHEQHTADGLIMQLKSQLTSSQTAAASGVDEQQWAQASAQLREENEELKARCDELERQLEESTSSGLEMDNMIQDLLHAQKDTASFQEAIDSLQLMLDSQRDKVESLTSDLTIKTTLNDELRTESAAARDRIAKLEYQLEQVTRSLEEVSSAKSRVSAELYSEQTRLQELRTEHDTLTQSYSQATDALKAISEQQSSANLRAEQLDKLLKTREAELQVTKECLKQLKVFNDGRAGKDKLTQLLDVVKARSDLTCAQQERRALEAELKESSEQLQKLQERLQQAQQEAEQCRKEKMQAQLEQKEALNKLTVLTDYFQEEKAQLTKELESESGLRHTAEGSAESVSSRIRNYDMQLMAYKAQVEMLKKELEDQEVSYRTQLAAQEQKAHESWVAARAAERKYDESKQETAQLRSRLLLMSKENSEQLPIAKPLPKHAEASNGSLSSPRPPLHDDLDGEHSLPLDSPPPIPPPPHLLPHLFPPPPHLFPPPPHLPGMPPPPFLPPSHFLPPPPMLDRRLPPAGRLASPPFHRRIEAASPPFHRRIGAASPPELLDRHSPPIFDRRSFSPASERSRYSDRQYSPDRHSRYSPDKIGRYSPDRQGRYSPDRQDQFSPDRSGRYSPDRPGRYFPDRLYDRHHPDRYNNSDRHSDAYSSNGRNSSPDGVAKRTSPTPPQRRPYDNGGQLGKGKKTSTPLGPNDR